MKRVTAVVLLSLFFSLILPYFFGTYLTQPLALTPMDTNWSGSPEPYPIASLANGTILYSDGSVRAGMTSATTGQPVGGDIIPPTTSTIRPLGSVIGDGSTGTTGGTTPASPAPTTYIPKTLNGVIYSDPASYNTAVRAEMDRLNAEKLNQMQGGFQKNTGFSDPTQVRGIDSVKDDSEFGRYKSALLRQIADAMDSYDKGETRAMGNLTSYYANLGDAYQSSQGIREGEMASDFTKAREDATRQKTEGLSSLNRALTDYIEQENMNRTNLARNYQSELDTSQNQTTEDLYGVLGRDVTANDLAYEAPTVNPLKPSDQGSLLKALQKSARGTFRLDGANKPQTDEGILSYLYNYA